MTSGEMKQKWQATTEPQNKIFYSVTEPDITIFAEAEWSKKWNFLYVVIPGNTEGGFSAKFRAGVCCPQFRNGTVGQTNFSENDTLG